MSTLCAVYICLRFKPVKCIAVKYTHRLIFRSIQLCMTVDYYIWCLFYMYHDIAG